MNLQKPYKVGIIGYGVVGQAVKHGLASVAEFKWYDKYIPNYSLEHVVEVSEFIFVCVPTPVKDDKTINLSIMDEVMGKIAQALPYENDKLIVIKSTVTPGTAQAYKEKYRNLNIVNNPEFLSDKTANYDFLHPARIILGGKIDDCQRIAAMYKGVAELKTVPLFLVSHLEAEVAKYTSNCFYATKLSFFNEIYQVCQKLDISYDAVKEMTIASGWVNPMHTDVPGPDGKLGWGGSCFPKDTSAFVSVAQSLGVEMKTLQGAIESNKQVRELTLAEEKGLKPVNTCNSSNLMV